jgi:hypothetical protein
MGFTSPELLLPLQEKLLLVSLLLLRLLLSWAIVNLMFRWLELSMVGVGQCFTNLDTQQESMSKVLVFLVGFPLS